MIRGKVKVKEVPDSFIIQVGNPTGFCFVKDQLVNSNGTNIKTEQLSKLISNFSKKSQEVIPETFNVKQS